MNKYLLSLMVLLPLSTFIVAQEEDETDTAEVEEVITTGIRSSLIDAISIKRDNVGVVDAITAEDIGKFADRNIAEALSRLVGITTNRDNGESTSVTVRGLGPEFNLVTLNGRSMPTVPPLWVGGRSFDFGDISSSGVAAVEVYKSSNAILPTGGLGATINMVTTKPLDGKAGGGVSVRALNHSKNEMGEDYTPEVDFVYLTNGESGDAKWGFSISGSHHVMNNRETSTNEITWYPSSLFNAVPAYTDQAARVPTVVTNNNTRDDGVFFYPNALGYQNMDNERTRENLQTTFQWEQGIVTATLDYTVSSVNTDQYGVKAASGFGGFDTTSMTIGPNGAVTKALVANADTYFDGGIFYNEFRYATGDTNNKSLGLNLEFRITDDFTLVADYHDSSAIFKGNPGGSATSTTIFSNGCWAGWGWWPTNETSACFTDRSFDFTNNKVGNLSWSVNETFQGADLGTTELEANDMAGREAYINYQDRRSELDQFQLIGSWDNNQGLFMESLTSVDFGISTQETTFHSQKWFNYLKTGYIEDGNPVNLTYMFLPDDVLEKQTFPGIMGSTGNPFYYFYMPKEDMFYWFGRATYDGDGNSGDGSWWNANGPARWPSSCYRNDAFDADGNPNGTRTISGYADPSNGATETPSSNWGQLEGCYGDRDNNSIIKESLDSIFVNFNFETVTDAGQELRAQFGLRYEEEERTSISDTFVPLNTTWSLGVHEYGDRFGIKKGPATFAASGSGDYVLPSLNVSFEHAENRVIRFAAGKTIARPSLEQLDSSNSIGEFTAFAPTQIGTGNPNLEPYESVNYDLAYEYYYKEGSYVALNLFVKEISGYHGSGLNQSSYNGVTDISNGPRTASSGDYNDDFCQWTANQGYWACGWTQEVDWTWLNTTSFSFVCLDAADCEGDPTTGNAIFTSNSGDPLYIFNIAQPVNKYDGTLEGIELAVQHLFDNGFGVMGNITQISGDTDVDPYQIGEQFALPGFGDAANFSAFYEDEKVSARVAYNLTGEYYTGNDEYNPLFVTERGTVDFNATYYVNDNVAVFVEGINVTDEDVHLFARYEEMTFLYQEHGPIYKIGFRANF